MSAISSFKAALRPCYEKALTNKMLIRLRSHQSEHARTVFLISTPKHGNLGDQAIVYAEEFFLRKNFPELAIFEIQRYQYEIARDAVADLVRPSDLIVIDGGGNVGTLWPEENNKINDIVTRFHDNVIAIFPQTAYFEDSESGRHCRLRVGESYATNPHLLFFSRDIPTYISIRDVAPHTYNRYTPDIVLSLDESKGRYLRRGALLCLREDKECMLDFEGKSLLRSVLVARGLDISATSTVVDVPRRIDCKNREPVLLKKWDEFGSAEVVLTDRLHGMLFSAITGTPCVALDNISHKVSNAYAWVEKAGVDNIRVAQTIDDVPRLLEEVTSVGPQLYKPSSLRSDFEVMRRSISDALL